MGDSFVLACCVTPVGFAFAIVFTRWLTARDGGYRAWTGDSRPRGGR